MITEPSQALLDETARREHSDCQMCGRDLPSGLRLQFVLQADGVVEAPYRPDQTRQGYHGLLHGGTIASLLDAAMTNSLFARGITALTARLSVRYLLPVRLGVPVTVRGWLVAAKPPIYNVTAEIRQDGHRAAQASAVFMPSPDRTKPCLK